MIPGMIAAMILLPLAMALLLLTPLRSMVVRGLGIAALPALIFLPAAWQGTTMSVTVLGWTFLLDQPGALLLAASALLWIIGGFAASAWL